MTGDAFLNALRAAIVPLTFTMKNNSSVRDGGIDFTLSDGRTFLVKRARVKDCANAEELRAYVEELVAR